LEGAKQDLLDARILVGPIYVRYVHELALGRLCETQGKESEAVSWYREALETCLQGAGISGGSALVGLLRLQSPQGLTPTDFDLYRRVAEQSWGVLRLPGRPNLSDSSAVLSAIKQGEANPPRGS
jgi:hypothetical protein